MQVQSLKTTHYKQRAVIIGSGIAGIVAGQQLYDKGFEVVILEAKSQVGGRLRVDENFTDYPLELGAEWIHWQKTPYYDMCLRAGAKLASDLNNQDIVQDPCTRKMITFEEFKEKYPEEGNILEIAAKECDSIDPTLTSQQWIEQKNFDPNLEYWYNSWMGIEFCANWTNTSAKGIGINQRYYPDGAEQFTMKNMSHLDVLKHTCPDSFNSIQLNTPVLCVDYSKEYIMVQTEQQTFVCDYVVCTVPISQLKKGAIKFCPEFDENRKTALSKMEMDVAIKIHLKFKERFWPERTGIHVYDSKTPAMWDSSYLRTKVNENVLCVFTAGDVSRTA